MRSRLAAGDLYQRITIKSATESVDAAGQTIYTWDTTVIANLPVMVERVTGGESLRGRQVSAETQLVFTARYRSDVTAEMQVTYESGTYGIVRVGDPYGDKGEMRIECRDRD